IARRIDRQIAIGVFTVFVAGKTVDDICSCRACDRHSGKKREARPPNRSFHAIYSTPHLLPRQELSTSRATEPSNCQPEFVGSTESRPTGLRAKYLPET